jgi:uncharacterized Ntn-hydrolase superfamily protein
MKRTLLGLVLIASLAIVFPISSGESGRSETIKEHITATFSIAAVDPETGICGGAVASRYPAVGKAVVFARPGVGVVCTQHYNLTRFGTEGLDLLEKGKLPAEAMGELLKNDPGRDGRQLAMVDMQGRAVLRHPVKAGKGSNYWGGMSGRFYACQGNTLTGREVIVAMAQAYEDTKGSLADRLMAALVAGDCAGGDHRGRLAAGIRICKRGVEGYWLELHVDKSKDAVIELLQKYVELKHEAKGNWPGGQPPFKHPCPKRPEPKAPAAK